MHSTAAPPLPQIRAPPHEAAATPPLASQAHPRLLSVSSNPEGRSPAATPPARQRSAAAMAVAALESRYAESIGSTPRARSDITSALSYTNATMAMRTTPPPSSSTPPTSDSLSWRGVAALAATHPSPATIASAAPNHSFFGKRAGAVAGPTSSPSRPHVSSARTPPPPPPPPQPQQPVHRTAAAAAAAKTTTTATSSFPTRQQQRRQGSASARASVLAKVRHRRLMPLGDAAAALQGDSEHGGLLTAPARGLLRAADAPLSVPLPPSEPRRQGSSSASVLGSATLRSAAESFASSRAPATLPSPLHFTSTMVEDLSPDGRANLASRRSSGGSSSSRSRGSDAVTSPSERENGSCASLTSLQQRLWTRTAGGPTVVRPAPHNTTVTTAAAAGRRRGGGLRTCAVPTPPLPHAGGPVVRVEEEEESTTTTVPVSRWRLALDSERVGGERSKHVASWLIQRLLGTPTTAGLFTCSRGGRGGGAGQLGAGTDGDGDDGDGGRGGHLRPLCERAVIAAYLLSSLIDGLPRHQLSLRPYAHMLLDFTFVSDTQANRALLGGTVQDEDLLDALETLQETEGEGMSGGGGGRDGSHAAQRVSEAGLSNTVHRGSRSSCLVGYGGCGDAAGLYSVLYPRFTRMTCAAAHYDASRTVVALAHDVRLRELHQRNVPRLLECTHRHWMRGLVRAVLRAWQRLCQERRVQEQRQRARWAERWTGERVRITLRRWRGYAALTLQVAEADSLAKALLAEKRAGIERLENESAAMQASSALLQGTLHRQDEERDTMELAIVQREQVYKKLLQHVREVDRVGSLMLRSLLLPDAPPVPDEADALNGIAAAVNTATAAGGQRLSAASLNMSITELGGSIVSSCSTDHNEAVVRHPPHALVALPMLLRWARACVASVQTEFIAFYPDDDDEEDEEHHHSDDEDNRDGETMARHSRRASTPARSAARAPRAGKGVPKQPSKAAAAAAASSPASLRSVGKSTGGRPLSVSVASRAATSRASSAGAASLAEPPPATRDPSAGLEALLVSPVTAAAPTSSSAASDTVLVPLHVLLLLMRGCGGGPHRSHDSHDVAAEGLLLSAAADGGVGGGGGDGTGMTVSGPSWELVRTVELAERVILEECHAIRRRDEEMQAGMEDGSGRGGGSASDARHQRRSPASSHSSDGHHHNNNASVSVSVVGVSLMYRLSSATRKSVQRVCRVVVDTYEQLTGTACIVTAEQLFERSRGTLLVFIAALLRYYTNWSVHRTQQLAPLSSHGKRAAMPASTAAAHEGTKHVHYEEWSHPPHSHRDWLAHVQRQSQWIALSFSALHDAIRLATRPVDVLSMVDQERVAGLIQRLSLTEFIDLLCRSPDHTMQSYVDMIGVVERYAPSLHLLFHEYALPLSQLRADGEEGRATSPGLDSAGDGAGDLYITGNTVWYLLCLTGLAGKPATSPATPPAASAPLAVPSPPFPATLHRPAVFSLVEQVTQGAVAATGVQRRAGSMRRGSAVTTSPTTTSPQAVSPSFGNDDTFSPHRTTAAQAVSVSCKGRPIPCYARALRDDRHVDLRADTGAVCVNYVQFVKLVIRLAHAWQCQQQQQPLMAKEAEEEVNDGEGGGGTAGPLRATRGSLTDARSSSSSPRVGAAAAAAASPRGNAAAATTPSGMSSQQQQQQQQQQRGLSAQQRRRASAAAENAASNDHVQYESIDHAAPLIPPYFNTFLGGLLLPRLLGAKRWIGATQRAFTSKPVLALLAQHHDSLLTIFDAYQRPCESRGVRAALPPPFSTMLASRLFTKIIDAGRRATTSLTADGGRGLSHAERASFVYAVTSSSSRRGSAVAGGWTAAGKEAAAEVPGGGTGRPGHHTRSQHNSVIGGARVGFDESANGGAGSAARDVGIVSVLRWKEVQALAKDLEWHRDMRLSEAALRHCFVRVVADAPREGEVLFFPEFLQLLCALAAYTSPNPTVPLEQKLSAFLQARVLVLLD
ncbi:hypothetical protein NESM_000417800 [Novymonas esmeraldas]|uniref:Calponin-homology (CH) domain-containing protein n=1 Tax=Novymonas esmeraldas TaxID=1808958 RepID=A0AAW0ELB3_9TRYP